MTAAIRPHRTTKKLESSGGWIEYAAVITTTYSIQSPPLSSFFVVPTHQQPTISNIIVVCNYF
jgi:hypothetical protein